MVKRIIVAIGWTLSVACTLYFFRFLSEYWHHVSDIRWGFSAWLVMAASLAMYLLAGLFSVTVWWVFLRGVGEKSDYVQTMRVFLISQFAKYLPGNIGHHVGRVALAGRAGMNVPRVIFSMTVEAIWTLTVLSALTLGSILAVGDSWLEALIGFSPVKDLSITILVLLLSFGVLLWSVRRWSLWKRGSQTAGNVMHLPGTGIYMSSMLMIVMNMLIMSVVVLLLGVGLFNMEAMNYWLVLAGIVVSWTLGYITPGAPAGLGVREVILVGMFGSMGVANAVGIAALLRLVTAVGDALLFVLGLLLPQAKNRG